MIKTVAQVFKKADGTCREQDREAVVFFKDDSFVVSGADICPLEEGTIVDVTFEASRDGVRPCFSVPLLDGPEQSAEEKSRNRRMSARLRFYGKVKKFVNAAKFAEILELFPGAPEMYEENPYFLFGKISPTEGNSIRLAPEDIARGFVPLNAAARRAEIAGFAEHELLSLLDSGSTCEPFSELVERLKGRLERAGRTIPGEDVGQELRAGGGIELFPALGTEYATAPQVFSEESSALEGVAERGEGAPRDYYPSPDRVEVSSGLTEEQADAVKGVFNCGGICVITGGPGTGKTTIIKQVISNSVAKVPDGPVYVLAPTGKAAKRAKLSLGQEDLARGRVETVHKFVGYGLVSDAAKDSAKEAARNAKLVVIDEASMLGVGLFSELLGALSATAKVVLVGDADQLPSVDYGNVLADVMRLGVPCYRLEKNHRSSTGIIALSKEVNEGRLRWATFPQSSGNVILEERDLSFETAVRAAELLLAERRMGNGSAVVLCPRKSGPCSVDQINSYVESRISESGAHEYEGGFRIGAPVIINDNNYRAPVPYTNGEVGIFRGVAFRGARMQYVVEVDGSAVYVEAVDDAISLAHAITIHKSQGSEYTTAIVVAVDDTGFLTRRSLYTAVTRAKEKVVILSNPEVLESAVANVEDSERATVMGLKALEEERSSAE